MKAVVRFDLVRGIFSDGDTFLVVGFAKSKEFKTLAGAKRWAIKMGMI